jgi:AraC-like DNA-binding protein
MGCDECEGWELAAVGGTSGVRRSAILLEIERRSADPSLNAVKIAMSLGITARYVHRLLEDTGLSFTHHVLQKRLATAAALLRDPQWRHRKIADIAAEAGFTDLSYFNRAFRRRHGTTPSEFRAAAGRDE